MIVPENASSDALDAFVRDVELALAELRDALEPRQSPQSGGSALSCAVESGLPPQLMYTVAETAAYTGVSVDALYREHKAGRLAFVMPKGARRGARIAVAEVDRWMKEGAR